MTFGPLLCVILQQNTGWTPAMLQNRADVYQHKYHVDNGVTFAHTSGDTGEYIVNFINKRLHKNLSNNSCSGNFNVFTLAVGVIVALLCQVML